MEAIKYTHTSELHNPKDALTILPIVFDIFKPRSIIDIGCGNGSWLNAAKKLGVSSVKGVDGIQVPEDQLLIDNQEFLKHDLTTSLRLNEKYDLAISLEVAEHLPESGAETFVQSLCKHSDVILFSAAIPGQGGQYHLNEQWPDYWQNLFTANGFLAYDIVRPKIWNDSNLFWWYRQNIVIYVKEGNIKVKDFQPTTSKIRSIVHPALYNRKMDKPKYMDLKQLKVAFKLVIKSIWKKI